MPNRIKAGHGLVYMKVGTHAKESLNDIIVRKRIEIEDTGYAFWGYGGNTCHPTTMVQPFAKVYEERQDALYLCMEPMQSDNSSDPIRAVEYSEDRVVWKSVPLTIGALGSKYALVIKNLIEEEFELPLTATNVALGKSKGVSGEKYIRGRVDKACLSLADDICNSSSERVAQIGLIAELCAPYAVFLR